EDVGVASPLPARETIRAKEVAHAVSGHEHARAREARYKVRIADTQLRQRTRPLGLVGTGLSEFAHDALLTRGDENGNDCRRNRHSRHLRRRYAFRALRIRSRCERRLTLGYPAGSGIVSPSATLYCSPRWNLLTAGLSCCSSTRKQPPAESVSAHARFRESQTGFEFGHPVLEGLAARTLCIHRAHIPEVRGAAPRFLPRETVTRP